MKTDIKTNQPQAPMVGDVFAIKMEKYGLFYLCQIVKQEEKNNAILLLDYFDKELPPIERVKSLSPLRQDHHFWKGEVFLFWDDSFDATRLVYIGNTKPIFSQEKIEDIGSVCNQHQPMLQYLWQQLPLDAKEAFKKALKQPTKKTKLWIDEQKEADFWQSIKLEPCVYEVECYIWHDALMDYLQTTPLISDLRLSASGQKVIDLSQTKIQQLNLDVTGVERLILNKDLYALTLRGDFSSLRVIEDPFCGKYLLLTLSYTTSFFCAQGIEQVKKIQIMSKSVDIGSIAKRFKALENLKIWGSNGKLTNILELKELKGLRVLWLMDIFGFDDFPKRFDIAHLDTLWLMNVPKSAGIRAKQEFKSIRPDITKLRDEEWIKYNLENPLGSWDGRDGTPANIAKKAMKLYVDTYKKLKQKTLTPKSMEEILKTFIVGFNEIDKKYSLDTLEREEIYDALQHLGTMIPLTPKSIEAMFDELRNF